MSVAFKILKYLGVVYVRYSGRVSATESIEQFKAYLAHPDCQPGQKQFVDLSGVTEPVMNYTEMLKLQALKADYFRENTPQTLVVYYAPSKAARQLATFAMRSWSGTDYMVCRMIDDEAAALAFLGLPAESISELLTEV